MPFLPAGTLARRCGYGSATLSWDDRRRICVEAAFMATSAWRAQRNAQALARLRRNLPDIFPAPVLVHALARPFIPPTPRRVVEAYWRHHPVRGDRLAPAL